MRVSISGIHHVTAIAGDAGKNLEFYAGMLGLRLVKKTVNFDAPDVYHLYYGDERGLPGSILTFFPYGAMPQGRPGKGMVTTTSFSAPAASLSWWEERLARFDVSRTPAVERLPGELVVPFRDPDGLALELVFSERETRPGYATGPVPAEHTLRGFFGVQIIAGALDATASLLVDHLGHRLISRSGSRHRLAATDAPGHYVDLMEAPMGRRGTGGRGTVHHIAFATRDAAAQIEVRADLAGVVTPTPVIDRQYFTSVYFREPGGVLFEVATAGPGFAVDEPADRLGESLKLPPQYEVIRAQLERGLPPIALKEGAWR